MLGLLACSLMLVAADDAAPPPGARAAYEAVRARAGRSPGDQVQLALWCEAHGLTSERLHHLALAVLADPGNVSARGLMGLVAREGRWLRPEAVAERAQGDPILAEYDARRMKAPYTAEGQWSLGVWCDENGLKDQARAHLMAVVRLDPTRDVAWKRLGYRRFEGRWTTDAEVAARKAEAEAQAKADHEWGPLLEKWRAWLGQPAHADEARAGLDSIDDPRAVPSIVRTFGIGSEGDQSRAVRLLGQVNTPASSRALALLVVWGKSEEIRRSAVETLRRRDPREYVGFLLAKVRDPIHYEAGLVTGADGRMHRTLLVEGKQHNVQTLYGRNVGFEPLPSWYTGPVPFAVPGSPDFGPVGLPVTFGLVPGGAGHHAGLNPAAQFQRSVFAAASGQGGFGQSPGFYFSDSPGFQADLASLEAANASVGQGNTRVFAALRMITGKDLPDDREAWKGWWVHSLGYALKSSSVPADAQAKPTLMNYVVSCFAAGTPVRTLTGDRPIEDLKLGDLVLSQDTETGSLGFRPIVGVYHNPPSETLNVFVGGEAIDATGFHRFWRAGRGWAMARELKVGDVVRTLGGLAPVTKIEPRPSQPVFNLDVADHRTFFVGRSAALVHDNSLPDPRARPFDAPAPVVAVASPSGPKSGR